MATQTLTATQLAVDGAGTNLTALLATPTATNLQFANTLNTILIVVPGASSETVIVDVECLVDGQSVTNFSSVSLTSTDVYTFGPYHSVIDETGTNLVEVTLSTITSIQVAVITVPGVF
jgi:hypothetical protein